METTHTAIEADGLACRACGVALAPGQSVVFLGTGRPFGGELHLEELCAMFCGFTCAARHLGNHIWDDRPSNSMPVGSVR